MAYGYPLPASPVLPVTPGTGTSPRKLPPATIGTWRYSRSRPSRPMILSAMVVSAALHAGLILGVPRRPSPPPPVVERNLIALTIPPPLIKELEEEPEPMPSDGRDAPPDLSIPVPMQADVPALPRPEDFVQALDFSSLLEKPDLSETRISVIPEHIRRGADLRERIGAIFNLGDLDRPPEPIVQPAPVFPFNLKREAVQGMVRVEFVVDTEGRVHTPFVIQSSHPGFEEAACTGVARWKFRPGMKNGRKVNTRMQVPIVFKIVDDMD